LSRPSPAIVTASGIRRLRDSPQSGVGFSRARPPTARRNAPLDASVEFGQRLLQLRTGCDPELHEDLVQVVLGGSVTDEQPTPDVPVGQSVPGKTGDVDLLVGQ